MLLAEQHDVDVSFTCTRGPSTRHVAGAAGMIVHALSSQWHEQKRCTGGGGSWQSSRETARAGSWHRGAAVCAGRYSHRGRRYPQIHDFAKALCSSTCSDREAAWCGS